MGTQTLVSCSYSFNPLWSLPGRQTALKRYAQLQSAIWVYLIANQATDCRFSDSAPNVVHMSVKPQEVIDDEENAKSAKGKASGGGGARPARGGDGDEPTAGCRCIIQWFFSSLFLSFASSPLSLLIPPNLWTSLLLSSFLLPPPFHSRLFCRNLHFLLFSCTFGRFPPSQIGCKKAPKFLIYRVLGGAKEKWNGYVFVFFLRHINCLSFIFHLFLFFMFAWVLSLVSLYGVMNRSFLSILLTEICV